MKAGPALVLALYMIAVAPVSAQENGLPGLDEGVPDPPEFRVYVDLDITQLVSSIVYVAIWCDVYGGQVGRSDPVGTGALVFAEDTDPLHYSSFAEVQPFDGIQIQGRYGVGIWSLPISDPEPLRLWTTGKCNIRMSDTPSTGFWGASLEEYGPMDCREATLVRGALKAGSCVWPGTSPDTATIEFRRPGVPVPDSAVEDSGN